MAINLKIVADPDIFQVLTENIQKNSSFRQEVFTVGSGLHVPESCKIGDLNPDDGKGGGFSVGQPHRAGADHHFMDPPHALESRDLTADAHIQGYRPVGIPRTGIHYPDITAVALHQVTDRIGQKEKYACLLANQKNGKENSYRRSNGFRLIVQYESNGCL